MMDSGIGAVLIEGIDGFIFWCALLAFLAVLALMLLTKGKPPCS